VPFNCENPVNLECYLKNEPAVPPWGMWLWDVEMGVTKSRENSS